MANTKTKKKAKVKVNDIFANATVIEQPKAKAKKNKKDKREVAIGEQLDTSAAIDALVTSLSSMKETIDEEIKEKMAEEFVKEAIYTHRKPESFRGTGTESSASCEIRKRSTRSLLREEELKVLQMHGIKTETKVIKEAVPEQYIINPKAFAEPKLLQQISKKLAGMTTEDGEGIVMLQEAQPAVESEVVGANAIDEAARTIEDPAHLANVFEILTVNALGKFKLDNASLHNIYTILIRAGIDASFENLD